MVLIFTQTIKKKIEVTKKRKNNNVIYNSTGLSSTELINILPEYEIDGSNIVDVATYKGGSYHSLIKQVDLQMISGIHIVYQY